MFTAMKTYKPDDELVKVLLANGYKEVHSLTIRVNGNGMKSKREFAIFNKNITSQTPHIQLNHGAIKEQRFQFYEPAIEEQQLRAMICFHKLPGSMSNTLRNRFRFAWHIASVADFFSELENTDSTVSKQISKPLRKKMLSIYTRVIL